MLIQSVSFQPNQLVFSPDAKSVAMGTWRSCEMMVDLGFTEKPLRSLFPKQTGMAADYPKIISYENQAL